MNPTQEASAGKKCAFCGELCLWFPSNSELRSGKITKRKGPTVHDSCKPFYILLKKLSRKSK